jgi:hypothetical protein
LTKRWLSSTEWKASVHPGRETLLPDVSFERNLTFEHIDELMLSRMGMTVGGLPAGHDPCHHHPVILQSRVVAELAIVSVQVRRPIWLWVAGGIALRDVKRIKRG